MADNKINLDNLNMSEEELFSRISNDELSSEKITAPRYSYWQSVFRVFFRNKINVVMLSLLAIIIIFSFIYPAVIGYDAMVDPFVHVMDSTAKHLKPAAAMEKFGANIHWILGAGASGESTFDAIWYPDPVQFLRRENRLWKPGESKHRNRREGLFRDGLPG